MEDVKQEVSIESDFNPELKSRIEELKGDSYFKKRVEYWRQYVENNPSETTAEILALKEMEAHIDPLTRTLSRNGIDYHFAEAIDQRKNRINRGLGSLDIVVFFCDADKLKRVNDSKGHPEGDKYLVSVSDSLKQVFPENYLIGRYGGDEFIVIGVDVKIEEAQELSDKIGDTYNDLKKVRNLADYTGISTGWAAIGEGQTLEDAKGKADERMYKRKRLKINLNEGDEIRRNPNFE